MWIMYDAYWFIRYSCVGLQLDFNPKSRFNQTSNPVHPSPLRLRYQARDWRVAASVQRHPDTWPALESKSTKSHERRWLL